MKTHGIRRIIGVWYGRLDLLGALDVADAGDAAEL